MAARAEKEVVRGEAYSEKILEELDIMLQDERRMLNELTIVRTNHRPRGLLGLRIGKIPRNPAAGRSSS